MSNIRGRCLIQLSDLRLDLLLPRLQLRVLLFELLEHLGVVADHRLILELQLLNRFVHLLFTLRVLKALLDADGL